MSMVLSVIAMVSEICAVYFAYKNNGQATMNYGLVGIFIILYAFIGLVLGMIARREKDKFYIFSYLGIIISIITLVGMGFIIFAGM